MLESCTCLSRPSADTSETAIPRQFGLDADDETARPAKLVRKPSKLHVSLEVFKCKFSKPSEGGQGPFAPTKEWTPLYYAVCRQREAALSHFLRAGVSPDDVDGIGQPPLCIAVANGHDNIVRILLEAGADVNAVTKDGGETALHIAIRLSRMECLNLILPCRPNLQAQTSLTGETPLHYAASKSASLATIVSLLKLGAKYDAVDAKGQTPAEAALQAKNLHGAVAIINAAHGKRSRLAKEKDMLLKHVQNTNGRFSIGNDLIADIFSAACDPDSTVLVEAIKRDDASLVRMFLEKGADPDRETASGVRPIFAALHCAGAPVVQALVKHKADTSLRDAAGLTVLQAVLESPLASDKEAILSIFDDMLDNGADATVTYPDGQTLLHRIVSPRFGHARVARLLIGAGVKAETRDDHGNTALHLATHSKLCLELLLKHGANPRQDNLDGLSPLLYAATRIDKDNEAELDALVGVSDLRQTNSRNQTVLHLAAQRGLVKLVRLLLRAQVETAAVDADKLTPLLLAIKSQQWAVVPLLAIPSSLNLWDQDGMCPLHHVACTIPTGASTWADVAAAVAPFCERGMSRSMRDRSGATPLIQAVKTLPEQGLPVVEALLTMKTERTASFNCVNHEDHQRCDALYYAATMHKVAFVEALLKHGATFAFEAWTPGAKRLHPSVETDKQIMKLLAQCEWTRRAGALRRQSGNPTAEAPGFSAAFPIEDIEQMVSMGLSVNTLPISPLGISMLWAVLRHIPLQPPMPPKYIHDAIRLILQSGANPNAETAKSQRRSPSPLPPPPRPFLEPPTNQQVQNAKGLRHAHSLMPRSRQSLPNTDAKGSVWSSRGSKRSRRSHPPFPLVRPSSVLPPPRASRENLLSSLYPITFLLEEVPTIDIDLVTLFLTKGAKLSIASPFYSGRYALHSAVKANRMDLVDEFLLQRADVNCVDQFGRTPLFFAARKGYWEIADALLRCGAKVNIEDEQKETPLHAAAVGGSRRIVAALLRSGAKSSVKNKRDETPLACVAEDLEEKERDKIVSMLTESLEREWREQEQNGPHDEHNATFAAKMIARREEGRKHREKEEEEEKERARKEKESVAKMEREQEERETQATDAIAATTATAQSVVLKPSRSSMFRRSTTVLLARPKVTTPPVSKSPRSRTSLLSMHVTTPPSPNRAARPLNTTPSSTTASVTSPSMPVAKLPAVLVTCSATADLSSTATSLVEMSAAPKTPRIDSGFGRAEPERMDESTPRADLDEPKFESNASKVGGAELKDWLALSTALDTM